MSNRYWVGGTGTWDTTDTTNWSDSSGGSGGFSVPSISDNVYFDANSGGGVCTKTENSFTLDLDFTGYTGEFAGTIGLSVTGTTLTLGSGMTFSNTGSIGLANAGTTTVTTNGIELTLTRFTISGSVGTVNLTDDFVAPNTTLYIYGGTFNTNNYDMELGRFAIGNTTTRTINLGSSTITLNGNSESNIIYNASVSGLTFNAGTSLFIINNEQSASKTINTTASLSFYDMQFLKTGATSSYYVFVSGSNTYNDITFEAGTEVTFITGSTHTISDLISNATSGSPATIAGSGGTFTFSKSSGTVGVSHLDLTDSIASGGATFNAYNSIDSGGNTGWNFIDLEVSTASATDVLAYSVELNGSIDTITFENATRRGFVYSTSTISDPAGADPDTLGISVVDESGSFGTGSFALSASTLDETTYYVRAFAEDGDKFVYGEQQTFTTLKEGYDIRINDVAQAENILIDTFQIRDNINQQIDECTFTMSNVRPELNQEIAVYYNGIKIFGGVIVKITTKKSGLYITYEILAKDYSQYLNRILINKTYSNQTVNQIIADMIDNYTEESFTYDNVDCDITIVQATFNRTTISQALDDLAKIVNYSWYVDHTQDIHFFAKNTELSPFNLTDTSKNFVWDSLIIDEDFSQIRNKVTVIGGDYVSDERSESYIADGEQNQFPLAYKFSELPTVEVDSVAQDVGVDGFDNEDNFDCFWNFEGKYIRFKESNKPAISEVVEITGTPLLPVIVSVPDVTSIAEFGTYEHSIVDEKITSRDDAIERAIVELESYANEITSGSFQTYTFGLRSGQTININVGSVNEDYIIQSVTTRFRGHENAPIFSVKISTVKTQNIITILQKLLRKEKPIIAGETVLELQSYADSVEMSDTLDSSFVERTPDYLWADASDPADEGKWNFMTWA